MDAQDRKLENHGIGITTPSLSSYWPTAVVSKTSKGNRQSRAPCTQAVADIPLPFHNISMFACQNVSML